MSKRDFILKILIKDYTWKVKFLEDKTDSAVKQIHLVYIKLKNS